MEIPAKQFGFLLLILLATIVSCSSDDSGNPETYIKFKVDENNYFFKDIITAEAGVLTLNGNNGQSILDVGTTQIVIQMPLNYQLGTFEVSGDFFANHRILFSSLPLNFNGETATNGIININSISGGFIVGTFSATVTNNIGMTITLINGEFKGFK